MEQQTFYITTPIYYPSDKLHIGHSYCSVAADAMARYKKLMGYDVFYLTGTDEHGQKIERRAAQAGVTPQQFVDDIVAGIQELWKLMDVAYDDFIRTTQDRHAACVQKIFRRLYEQGDIYKSQYEGWYCTPCESFWTALQLKEGCCPDCGRAVERTREESYFFRLSKYQDWLIAYIRENPDFIQPVSRANEMLNNFLLPGLEDLCVSRTSHKWGVPVDFDEGHVVYVWIDALSNYISALGYLTGDDARMRKYWPADVHLVGKEIVRFHTIIWPILLKALDLPLPKQVFGHGWLVLDGGKMSKSKGNVVDPVVLCERYSSDAVRYFLLREVAFGSDGVFSHEALLTRINADLANDLGNLVSRTVSMIEKYFDGVVPAPQDDTPLETELRDMTNALPAALQTLMDGMQFSNALAEIWKLVARCNRYIDQTAPWALGKDPAQAGRLGTVLYTLAECIRNIGVVIAPIMPRTPARIFAQMGIAPELTTWASLGFGKLPAGGRVQKGEALFPRIDVQAELARYAPASVPETAPEQTPAQAPELTPFKEEIDIDAFEKVDLRVAKVLAAERIPKADKLLKLTVRLGTEERTVVSGIAKWYTPEEMVGKSVVLVANLKPVKLRGVLSQGMILCAGGDNGALRLVSPMGDMPDGETVR